MEAQPPSGSSSSSTAHARWVMLEQYLETKVEGSSCSPTDDDAKTLAAARTSTCLPIKVSLRVAEPPAPSRVLLWIPDGGFEDEREKSKVLAAHGDSVLIQVFMKQKKHPQSCYSYTTSEYFVYDAGAPAADPLPPRAPSLRLLPPYYETTSSGRVEIQGRLLDDDTGLLLRRRRGAAADDDELVVAKLEDWTFSEYPPPTVTGLYLFRSGEWNLHQFEISEAWGLYSVRWHTVVPVDDRRLCWVDLLSGVMLIDVVEETPTLQFVRLPMEQPHDAGGRWSVTRNVCATAGGGGALKFVNIFSRCCCGAAACCGCEHSRHAYVIHTWTMRIDGDGDGGGGDMEWVKDGVVDATELWALDAYKLKGLPRDPLDRPVVSWNEPEVICFRLRDTACGFVGRQKLWQVMVDMRSKTIRSVSRHDDDEEEEPVDAYWRDNRRRAKLIPTNISSNYFVDTLAGEIQIMDDADEQMLESRDDDDDPSNNDPTLQTSSSSSFADDEPAAASSVQALLLLEMFEALGDIPSYGLRPDEVIKAYRILISSDDDDSGRRLSSLSRLPKGLRKDWLLMEIIKATTNT